MSLIRLLLLRRILLLIAYQRDARSNKAERQRSSSDYSIRK
jgi:hypothetical protein